jgi:hypothetical protein
VVFAYGIVGTLRVRWLAWQAKRQPRAAPGAGAVSPAQTSPAPAAGEKR